MSVIHYRTDRPNNKKTTTGEEIIAAFPDMRTASAAVYALRDLPVSTELIPIPLGSAPSKDVAMDAEASRHTITGALFGAIWGMFLGALVLNFMAVDPSLITTAGTVIFATIGGMAVGGFMAGVSGAASDPYHYGRSGPRNDSGTEAFVMVSANRTQDLDDAYSRLRTRDAIDVYRA